MAILYLIPTFMIIDAVLTRLAIPLGAKELNPLQFLAGTDFGLILHLLLAGVMILILKYNSEKIESNKITHYFYTALLFIEALVVLSNSWWMFTHW